MRQVFIGGKWINGTPTQAGQRFRFADVGGWSYGTYQPDAVEPVADMRITKLAFKQRFTQAERIAIREAVQTVPEVYDFEDLVNSASFIDLARPDTIAAVHYIEAGGLIAEGRAVEILSPPVTEIEQYRGDL
jgi:hypothetical protein